MNPHNKWLHAMEVSTLFTVNKFSTQSNICMRDSDREKTEENRLRNHRARAEDRSMELQ